MEKGMRIALITICFVLSIFLVGVLIWGIQRGGFENMENLKVVKEETYESKEIKELTINTKFEDVKFYQTEEENIRIVQKSNKKVKAKDLFQISNDHSTLTVEGKIGSHFCIGFCFFNDTIYEIYVPKSYNKAVKVNTTSGDVIMDHGKIMLSELNIVTTSGDIDLKNNISADTIKLKSTSGDIETTFLKGSSIDIHTVSGDIENEFVEAKNVFIKTTSGEVENRELKGSVEISTTSGDIEIDSFDIIGESKLHSTSGDIHVQMNSGASTKMSADSVSGSIRFPHSESVIGKGEHPLSFKTVSGDIKVTIH